MLGGIYMKENHSLTVIYIVVVNHEEQYSILPFSKTNPIGWRDFGFSGERDECLQRIAEIWTDMRPKSLRI